MKISYKFTHERKKQFVITLGFEAIEAEIIAIYFEQAIVH